MERGGRAGAPVDASFLVKVWRQPNQQPEPVVVIACRRPILLIISRCSPRRPWPTRSRRPGAAAGMAGKRQHVVPVPILLLLVDGSPTVRCPRFHLRGRSRRRSSRRSSIRCKRNPQQQLVLAAVCWPAPRRPLRRLPSVPSGDGRQFQTTTEEAPAMLEAEMAAAAAAPCRPC